LAFEAAAKAMLLRTLVIFIALQVSPALAGDLAVAGRVGYLSEWGITATVRNTANGRQSEFAGPLVMKHIGFCASNRTEEKSGEIRFWRTDSPTSTIEGVLTFADEQCTFETQTATHDGIMYCPTKVVSH
jgi:hypothetical protein